MGFFKKTDAQKRVALLKQLMGGFGEMSDKELRRMLNNNGFKPRDDFDLPYEALKQIAEYINTGYTGNKGS